MSDRLIGRWRLVRANSQQGLDPVLIEFDSQGRLTYSIDAGDRIQIISLTYEIQGETIRTDQPSQPRAEVTRFGIGSDGLLELEKDGERSWYERAA